MPIDQKSMVHDPIGMNGDDGLSVVSPTRWLHSLGNDRTVRGREEGRGGDDLSESRNFSKGEAKGRKKRERERGKGQGEGRGEERKKKKAKSKKKKKKARAI